MPIRGTYSIVLVPSRVIYYEILIFVRISDVKTLRRRLKEFLLSRADTTRDARDLHLLVIRILSWHWLLLPRRSQISGRTCFSQCHLLFPVPHSRDCFTVHSYSYVVVSLASLLSHTLQLRNNFVVVSLAFAPFIDNNFVELIHYFVVDVTLGLR